MLDIIIKSFKDLFDKRILFASLIPIVIATIFWGVMFFVFHTQINNFVVYLVSHIPFIGDSSWVQSAVETIGGILIYYELLIISSVLIVGLIADSIVDRINNKYYHNEKRGFGSIKESIFIALKQNLIFMGLFIILLPTMFIPILNIFVHLMLWSLLIKKPTFYDSISMYATKEEFNSLENSNKFTIRVMTLISASLFLIPIFGIFVYIVQLLFFTHFNLQRLQKLR